MAVYTSALFLLFLPLINGQMFGNTKSCQDLCHKTYEKQNADEGYCLRGCRMLMMIDFVNDEGKLTDSRDICLKACLEAYGNITASSCAFGCQSQLPAAEMRRKEMAKLFDHETEMLQPLMRMQDYYSYSMNCFFSHLQRQFISDIPGPRMIIIEQIVSDDNRSPEPRQDVVLDSNVVNVAQVNRMKPKDNVGPQLMDVGYNEESPDWLSCLSRKYRLSRMTLFLLSLFLVVVICFFCISLFAPSKDQQIKREMEKLSIYGDLEYLQAADDDKLFLRAVNQQEPCITAAPLPIKIQIQDV